MFTVCVFVMFTCNRNDGRPWAGGCEFFWGEQCSTERDGCSNAPGAAGLCQSQQFTCHFLCHDS